MILGGGGNSNRLGKLHLFSTSFIDPVGKSINSKQVRLKTGLPIGGGGKAAQEVWITKWVDYSSKYGMGYLLINGATGVYFNDSTKIILSPCGTYFDYIER
jgi:POLO box duplicated region